MGPTTFLTVREFLWYNCSIFCGLRNNSRNNEEIELKQKQHPVVDVTADRSKLQCYKEQYCIGTWNVRSTNQGKLEVVKQEMARVNIDILGISELEFEQVPGVSDDQGTLLCCSPWPHKDLDTTE